MANIATDVDEACREAAVEGALDAGFNPASTLFVNVEASTLDKDRRFQPIAEEAVLDGRLRVMVELTERALRRARGSFRARALVARGAGFGIALDDVGSTTGRSRSCR